MLHGRMVNLPIEIVLTLHQQIVLDMDWATKNAATEEERRSMNFKTFLRLAPCHKDNRAAGGGGGLSYRYFDDEVLAERAEFAFTVAAPASFSKEQKQLLTVMLVTEKGYFAALDDLVKIVQG